MKINVLKRFKYMLKAEILKILMNKFKYQEPIDKQKKHYEYKHAQEELIQFK